MSLRSMAMRPLTPLELQRLESKCPYRPHPAVHLLPTRVLICETRFDHAPEQRREYYSCRMPVYQLGHARCACSRQDNPLRWVLATDPLVEPPHLAGRRRALRTSAVLEGPVIFKSTCGQRDSSVATHGRRDSA